MGRIMRGSGIARRLRVSQLLLGAVLGTFGSLLLGALGTATAAWASDETAEATGLAAVTDPITAEVSDMSRLAARLVPHIQQGHGTPTDEGSASGLVSDLVEPVGSLMDETDGAVRTVLRENVSTGHSNDESVGDSAAGIVTPLVGALFKGTASITESPAPAVSGVYETVAPATETVDVLARLVTDGLVPPRDETPPGGVLADGRGQPSFTTFQTVTGSTEAAAALARVSIDRSAADLECSAATTGAQETDSASDEDTQRAPDTNAVQPWSNSGPRLPDLNVIPGGATGSTAGISVDSGNSAVEVSSSTDGEQVSFARKVVEELGRPQDRAAELSVAPD